MYRKCKQPQIYKGELDQRHANFEMIKTGNFCKQNVLGFSQCIVGGPSSSWEVLALLVKLSEDEKGLIRRK